MFLGHYAVAFAAKRSAPKISLGACVLAAQFLDLLWPVLLLLGWERVHIIPGHTAFTPLWFVKYPYSHSLLAVLGWGALFAGVALALRRTRREALVLLLAVASHWGLDLIAHRPDLPLTPWTDGVYGLGLWNNVAATLGLEFALLAGGAALYLRSTEPRDRWGSIGIAALLVFLSVIQVANAASPPPPSVPAVAWVSLSLWILVPWAGFIDRHRAARGTADARTEPHAEPYNGPSKEPA